MKALFTQLLVLLAAGLALLLSGCGGGGSDSSGPSLITTPYSRNTGPLAQSLDLVGALDNVDAPAGKEYLNLINLDNGPVYYLNELEVPSDIASFYALGQGEPVARNASGGTSRLLAKNEMAITALARALARSTRGVRSGARSTVPIDFIGENGIHWVGTHDYTVLGSTVGNTLNVTGTRDGLTITVNIDSDSDSTVTDTSISTEYAFTYSVRITGAIGTDAIELKATGDGDGNDTVNLISFAGNGRQQEQTDYQIAVNNRVTYRAKTSLDQSYLTPDGASYQVDTSYTADAWLFAEDGYWVHAVTTIDADGASDGFSFTATASDGYSITFDGVTGTLTDHAGSVLANLSYNAGTNKIKVDFTFAMEILYGAPDYVEIELYMR